MTDISENNITNENINNEETASQEQASGNVKISDEVIGTITAIAIKDVAGVSGLGTTLTSEIAQKFVKKSTNSKGIRISSSENCVTIDINVIVKYGVDIPSVAWEVQDTAKKSVEAMTGLTVDKVNVHVVGITADIDNTEKPEKTNEKM